MSGTRNWRLWGKITVFFVICFFVLPAHAKYGGGSGTAEYPYLIYNADQLNDIGANKGDWNKHFKLMADIDLSAYTGTSFNMIGTYPRYPFAGVFDGNGHTISNFSYTSTDKIYMGLFGYVEGPNAEIKNLVLIDPNVEVGSWPSYIGSLVGYLSNGTITNCYIEGGNVSAYNIAGGLVAANGGTISGCSFTGRISGGSYIGGLVGRNFGTVTNCYSSADVLGESKIGCLVGQNDEGTITNSYASGSVTAYSEVGGLVGNNDGTTSNCCSKSTVLGENYVGGFVGKNADSITNCYSTGKVDGKSAVGGLVGLNDQGKITKCYSTHSVSGDRGVGGLVGSNYKAEIINCYSKCNVLGDEQVGGLVGGIAYGKITNCYSTGSVLGNEKVGGLVGRGEGPVTNSFWDIETSGQMTSVGGTGKTTAEMKMENTFVGWWCEPVWTIEEGEDYPHLLWEDTPGEPMLNAYGGGSGQPNDPYLIYTAEQLNTIGLVVCDWDKNFKLTADVDLSAFTETSFNVIGFWRAWTSSFNKPFTGVFDGNGHVISNFSYSSTGRNGVALFGNVNDPNAEIKSLGLIDPNVDAGKGDCVGSMVGVLRSGTITNCYVQGGSVSGRNYVGELVAYNFGIITNCYSTGSVSGHDDVGGLVGTNRRCDPSECFYGTISNCYAAAGVMGNLHVGGLLGSGSPDYVFNSFWDIETSGQTTSDGGTGLPTGQMQIASTFINAGWDFNTPIWTIDEGVDYPRLWWEFVPMLHAEPEVTLGTSNTISWEPVVGNVEYYAECAEDANFTSIIYNSGWIMETSCEFSGLELGKRYWYSVKARNAAGVETDWSNVESSLQCTLANAMEIKLEPESLKNENMKNALLKKIDATLKMIEEGNYTGALSKLRNDILAKTNGCAETGQPDKNDWIITCEQQCEIYPLVIETIDHVKGLMGE